MKTKKLQKRFELNKQTLANLDALEQKAVKGGIETVNCTFEPTCLCPHTGRVCLSVEICL